VKTLLVSSVWFTVESLSLMYGLADKNKLFYLVKSVSCLWQVRHGYCQ